MVEADSIIPDPKVRLTKYGVPEWRIDFCTDILAKVVTLEELERALREQHATVDWSQALMPVFRPIYQNEPDIRKRVQQGLTTTSIGPAVIDEYFTGPGDQPYIVFFLRYEDDISLEERERFNGSAAQMVLDTCKAYLIPSSQKPTA